jgi:hypothetical protein
MPRLDQTSTRTDPDCPSGQHRRTPPWLGGLGLLLVLTISMTSGVPLAPLAAHLGLVGVGGDGSRTHLSERQLLGVLVVRAARCVRQQSDRPLPRHARGGACDPSPAAVSRGGSCVQFAHRHLDSRGPAPTHLVRVAHLALPPPDAA